MRNQTNTRKCIIQTGLCISFFKNKYFNKGKNTYIRKMRNNKNLNIPVTILHVMDDVQYKIGGKLLSINENAETCTIKFTNGRIEKDIPMSDIYINEGFIDAIKSIGKKISNAFHVIMKKVKGLIAISSENGSFNANSFCNPVNLAILQSRGDMPEGVTFYSSEDNIEIAKENGINVKRPNLENAIDEVAAKYEIPMIEKYWKRVMNVSGSTDKTIEESINYVNRTYYNSHRLNEEAPMTLYAPQNEDTGKYYSGSICDGPELVATVKNLVQDQIDFNSIKDANDDIHEYTLKIESLTKDIQKLRNDLQNATGEEADKFKKYIERKEKRLHEVSQELDDAKRTKADLLLKTPNPGLVPLIFGAPGVGKTQIVKQLIREFRNDPDMAVNMDIQYVDCGKLESDSVKIPIPDDFFKGDLNRIEEAALSWLPAYNFSSDNAENYKNELVFARCLHRTKDKAAMDALKQNFNEADFLRNTTYWNVEKVEDYQGGILFLDELLRCAPSALPLFMGICAKTIGSLRLAKSWAVVAASNREIDVSGDAEEAKMAFKEFEQKAISDRFTIIHFVPKKADWLKWAKQVNSNTGLPNVLPMLVDYIEAIAGDAVWYPTVDNGGYDREGKAAGIDFEAISKRNANGEGQGFVIGQSSNNGSGIGAVTRDDILTKDAGSVTKGVYKSIDPRAHENATTRYYNVLRNLLRILKNCGVKRVSKLRYKDGYVDEDERSYKLKDFASTDTEGRTIIDTKALANQVVKIPEERFKSFYKSQAGKYYEEMTEYNPASIESALENIFYEILSQVWTVEPNDNQGDNELSDMQKFYDFYKEFDQKDILDIYETGCYVNPDKLFKDNISSPSKSMTTPVEGKTVTGSDWKKERIKTELVFRYLLENYPGQTAQEDFEEMLKYLQGVRTFRELQDSKTAGTGKTSNSKNIFEKMLRALTIIPDGTKRMSPFGKIFAEYYGNDYDPTTFDLKPSAVKKIDSKFANIVTLTFNKDNVSKATTIELLKSDKFDYHIKAVICVMYDKCRFFKYMVNVVKYLIKSQILVLSNDLIGQFKYSTDDNDSTSLTTYISKYAKVDLKKKVTDKDTKVTIDLNTINGSFVNLKNMDKDNANFISCIALFKLLKYLVEGSYNAIKDTGLGRK